MADGNGGGDLSSFTLSDGTIVSGPDELIRWCEEHTEDGTRHLLAGDFARWLAEWGRDDLAQVAADAVAHGHDDPERLSLFIGFCKVAEYFRDSRDRRFTFLLVGRTGVGKSSTINTLLGKEVAEVGDTVPVTSEVVAYDTDVLGIPCRVVDTPGLSDGSHMDADYIAKMHAAVGDPGVDCVWFVTPLYETRVRDDELLAINHITRAFGPDIWTRAVVVLSFADLIPDPGKFARKMDVRPAPLRDAIRNAKGGEPLRSVGKEVAEGIPFVAVTNEQDTTPDGVHWLGRLYVETLGRMSTAGFGPLFLALIDRTAGIATIPGVTHVEASANVYISQPIIIDQEFQNKYENVVSNKIYDSTGYKPEPGLLESVVRVAKAVGTGIKKAGGAVKRGLSKLFGG